MRTISLAYELLPIREHDGLGRGRARNVES